MMGWAARAKNEKNRSKTLPPMSPQQQKRSKNGHIVVVHNGVGYRLPNVWHKMELFWRSRGISREGTRCMMGCARKK